MPELVFDEINQYFNGSGLLAKPKALMEFPSQVTRLLVHRDGTLIVAVEGGHRYRVWRSRGKFYQKRLS